MSKSTPFFSVIIPTRNRAELLCRCIKSVFDQEFEDWELIIVDDGSTDETRERVSEFDDPRLTYRYQAQAERSSARNAGIRIASGHYICFLDDDDFIKEDHLSIFHDAYQGSKNEKVILRTGYWKSRNGKLTKTANYDSTKHNNPIQFAAYHMCGLWTLAIPSEFLEDEKLPEEFPHWQDTHLILRLFLKHPLLQLDHYSYLYYIHSDMGSIRAVRNYDPEERADLNVAAIKDLFLSHGEKLSQYLPAKTLEYLISEKYLQYYINDFRDSGTFNPSLWKKATKEGYFLRLWKNYIIILKFKLGLGSGTRK